ncbi:Uncharacterised protein [Klebsiella pneumoniae]|nr:Uncharacterised protein [Klebsiella pneumoniae]
MFSGRSQKVFGSISVRMVKDYMCLHIKGNILGISLK